jgi:uncharacterized protein
MKIASIGASGNAGTRILNEALNRGHRVTAIVRNPERLGPRPGLVAKKGDVTRGAESANLLAGHDAVISSVRFQDLKPQPLIEAVRKAGVKRLLVVGGAGSLEVAPGLQLVDTPEFPKQYKPEALAGREFLSVLRGAPDLEWTFVSPSAFFEPGARTGKFRIGGDQLLKDEAGRSKISFEDFAVAMLDELEKPLHVRKRFTVGY